MSPEEMRMRLREIAGAILEEVPTNEYPSKLDTADIVAAKALIEAADKCRDVEKMGRRIAASLNQRPRLNNWVRKNPTKKIVGAIRFVRLAGRK